MSEERTIPTPAPSDLPSFRVLADGREISPEYHVIALTVTKEVNRIPSAEITLLDGDVAGEDFVISGGEDSFLPGKKIQIHAGYHSDDTPIFKGVITGHSIKARKNKSSRLVIECRDEAVKMTLGRKDRYFYGSTDSEIMEEIISGRGLDTDVKATATKHREMVQYRSTDWDFILMRANANGLVVAVDDGKVSAVKPDAGKEPALSLIYGSTMLEFEAEMESRSQSQSVKSFSWDPSAQEVIEAEGKSPAVKEQGNVDGKTVAGAIGLEELTFSHTGAVRDEELKAWAEGAMLQNRFSRVTGRVKCQGFGGIKPLDTLKLSGVGARFNGVAFVSGVRHTISMQNWETDIQFGLRPRGFTSEVMTCSPAAGLLPAVNGLQTGVVTKLEGDPEGEHRVQVRIPLLGSNEEGVWARVARLDGGSERGSFFLPEIGDEVVLGFLDDDPRHPVVLGMFNSSAKPAPLDASDDNNEKGFVSREKIRLIFDDGKKSVLIETPGGSSLAITDDEKKIILKDSNGNTIEMGPDGISLESAKDLNIKASGDVKVDGVNLNLKSSARFKAEGSAGAELSTGATAVLKGSLVQIN